MNGKVQIIAKQQTRIGIGIEYERIKKAIFKENIVFLSRGGKICYREDFYLIKIRRNKTHHIFSSQYSRILCQKNLKKCSSLEFRNLDLGKNICEHCAAQYLVKKFQ